MAARIKFVNKGACSLANSFDKMPKDRVKILLEELKEAVKELFEIKDFQTMDNFKHPDAVHVKDFYLGNL
jgi:hypothetical protein